MFLRLSLFLALLVWPFIVRADTVVCPVKADHVLVEAGHKPAPSIAQVVPFANVVQQDIGGDYDEDAILAEWNDLHMDKSNKPVTAYCFREKNNKNGAAVSIPATVHRCLFLNRIFLCKSGTVACPGYISQVRLQARGKDGTVRDIEPSNPNSKTPHNKQQVWKNLDEKSKTARLVVQCSSANIPDDVITMDIPEDMKECSLINKRFRCTATPEKHDFFWPEK